MHAAVKVIYENGIDFQYGILFVCGLYHIPDGQGSGISAVLKISRIKRILTHLVEDLARPAPFWKNRRRVGGLGARDVFVFVVFLAALNDSVRNNILDCPQNFRLGGRDVYA